MAAPKALCQSDEEKIKADVKPHEHDNNQWFARYIAKLTPSILNGQRQHMANCRDDYPLGIASCVSIRLLSGRGALVTVAVRTLSATQGMS